VIDESVQDDAALYALGLLSPEEAARFEAAMAGDPEIAALVAQLETGAAALAAGVPAIEPPEGVRDRIMAQVRQPANVTAFRQTFAWVPWTIAAGFAVLAGHYGYERYRLDIQEAAFVIRDRNQQGELDRVQALDLALRKKLDDAVARLAASEKNSSALQAEIDGLHHQVADLQARDALSEIKIATLASQLKDDPKALAVIVWDGGAQKGILQTYFMPNAQPDEDYQLWIIDPDYKTPVSAGVFNPEQGSRFQPIHRVSKAEKFAISLEKKGGSETPQGPIVLVGG